MTTVNAVGVSLSGQTGTGSFAGSTSPTFAGPMANNFLEGYSTTATAAATTTLTASSNYFQFFTGSTTQTVALPVTSTLVLGQSFYIVNNSTGVVTVQSSGGNTIQAMASGSTLLVTCILTSGTSAASWNAQYLINADLSGAVLLNPGADQSIIAYNLFLTNGGFISGSATGSQASAGGLIQAVGLSGALGSFVASSYYSGGSGSAPTYWHYKSRSATVGSFTTVQTGDTLGRSLFYGDDGTQFTLASSIVVQAAGTISSGVVPGYMTISTANTSGVISSAITIDQNQKVSVLGNFFGDTTIQANGGLISGNNTGGTAGNLTLYSPTAALGTFQFLAANNASAYDIIVTNASFGQSTNVTLVDPGASTANWVLQTSGSFTPTLTCSTPGDLSVVYGTRTFKWVRTGNVVTINGVFVATPTYTTASGDMRISGFPFTFAEDCAGSIDYINAAVTWPVGSTTLNIYGNGGTTYITLGGIGSATGSGNVQITGVTSTTLFTFQFTMTFLLV